MKTSRLASALSFSGLLLAFLAAISAVVIWVELGSAVPFRVDQFGTILPAAAEPVWTMRLLAVAVALHGLLYWLVLAGLASAVADSAEVRYMLERGGRPVT